MECEYQDVGGEGEGNCRVRYLKECKLQEGGGEGEVYGGATD